MDNDSQQQTPNELSAPHASDTEVTLAAQARPGALAREAEPEPELRPTAQDATAEESRAALNGVSAALESASEPLAEPAQIVHPPAPANFPPPLPAAQGAGPNELTYQDMVVPRPQPGWQAPPAGQPRQPTPRPARGQPTPPPTHVPWQVAQSWGATTLSIQANTAAGASYLLWWVSGLLVYFNERHNRFVRFHAMQSILLTGVLSIYSVVAYLVSQLLYDLAAATNQHAFHTLGTGVAILSFVVVIGLWLGAMIAAWSGTYFRWPIIGKYAERYAAPPAQPPQY